MATVDVLYDGYSKLENGTMLANCSCTLIQGEHNILVDCMTAWDKDKLIDGLKKHGLNPGDINYLIGTHGHSDHVGNLNLFTNATHIVGFTISNKNEFYIHPFEKGEPFPINKDVHIIPTPGHTAEDVSVVVTTTQKETIIIAGDIFEKVEDIKNSTIWKEAGSLDPVMQEKSRQKILLQADFIVPGHGPMFNVTSEMKIIDS